MMNLSLLSLPNLLLLLYCKINQKACSFSLFPSFFLCNFGHYLSTT
ncbi:hypothetical protein AMTRI_Chr07g76000 [Amborella trichopoda]